MDVSIRRGNSAEDVNALVRMHGEVYESEFGLDPSFAADVATQMAELRRRGWPGPGEGLWLAERGDQVGRLDHALRGRRRHRPARPTWS